MATTVINFEFALKLVSEHVHLGSPHTRTGGHHVGIQVKIQAGRFHSSNNNSDNNTQ